MSASVQAFADGAVQARGLAQMLEVPIHIVEVHRFPDSELLPTVSEPSDTIIVYRSLDRPNEKLVELMLAAEAWRRLGAQRLVLVAPYLPYMRQDQAFAPGQAISQRAVGKLLSACFDRVVTVAAHLHRTHDIASAFPRIEAQNLSPAAALATYIGWRANDPVIVGPDAEASPLAGAVAERLSAPWFSLSKIRSGDRNVEVSMPPDAAVEGRCVVLVDDICSSGATLVRAVELLKRAGAAEVCVTVVHALFDADAERRLSEAGVCWIASTDSVPHPTNAITLAATLADALRQEVEA